MNTVLPKKDFFAALDSDGCVFDSMPMKHKQGFIPAIRSAFSGCRDVGFIAEIWEHINLFSIYRGINRYSSLLMVLKKYTEQTSDLAFSILMEALEDWIDNTSRLSRSSLSDAARNVPVLQIVLHWSDLANHNMEFVQDSCEIFTEARRAIALIHHDADLFVVSQSTQDSLFAEWDEHDLLGYVSGLDGQENGTKKELLQKRSAYYPQDRKLFAGDAPSDLKAAKESGMYFFPVMPGSENQSWADFCDRIWPSIVEGDYQVLLEKALCEKFLDALSFPDRTGTVC